MRYNVENSITNYKKLIEKTDIAEIVITNQRLKKGHIRFDNNPFCYNVYSFQSKEKDKEVLKLWIDSIPEMNETSIKGKSTLMKDIVENTFNPNFKPSIPENHEIFIAYNKNDIVYFNYKTGIVIPPLKNNIFYKYSTIFIIGNTYKPIKDIFNFNDVDTSFIKDILNKIMKYYDIKDMKRLVYNYIFRISEEITITYKNQHHFDIIDRVKSIFKYQISNYYPYNKFKEGFDNNIENDIMLQVKDEMILNNISLKDTETLSIYINENDYFRFQLFAFIVKNALKK